MLVRYKYKTPAKAGIIYLFITSKKKASLSRFFGPAFIMYVEWDSGDYSARMRNEPPPLDITSNVGEMISFHFVTLSIKLNPYKAPFLANNAKTTTRYNAQESPCFKRLDR